MSVLLIPTASEAEWLEARRQGVTASEIAVIMGLSPYDSPYGLYHRKLGILPPLDETAAMERGRVLEPYIAGKFGEAHPMEYWVEGDGRELYASPDRGWQMATPDRRLYGVIQRDGAWIGYSHQPVGVLECKVDGGSDEWGEPGTDEIPVHYRAQVLWQMDVMGVETGHVACLRVRDWKVREYVIQMDDDAQADLKLMRDEARDFLDRIDMREPPDVDWRPATLEALKTLHPSVYDDEAARLSAQLARRYRAAVKNVKHWEQRKRLYEAQIREAMGDHRRAAFLGTGQWETFARRDVYEQREHVRKATTVDKLVPVYPKEKKNERPDSQ